MTTPERRRPPAGGQRPRQNPSRAGGPQPRTGGSAPRGGKPQSQAGRPRPAGDSLYTAGAGSTRSAMERSSATPLVFLHQLPRWLPPLVMLALLITGFAVPGWIGATALALVALFLGWLGYLSWPALTARGRLLRAAAVACILAIAVIQAGR